MDGTGQMWFIGGNGVATASSMSKAAVKIPNMVLYSNASTFGPGDMDSDGVTDMSEVNFTGQMLYWKGSDMATALGF